MDVSKKTIGGTVEILAADLFEAVPVTIRGSDPVKAGMPITQDGNTAADGTGAIGILLYDVDPAKNPVAAVVVEGIIDWQKVKAYNTSVTADAQTIANMLPKITFREVVDGKTYVYKAG